MLPIIMLIVLGVMMYLTTSKQKKAMKAQQEKLNAIQPGDKVVTIGGLHGVVSELRTTAGNNTVLLDCEGIYLEFERQAIKTVIPGTGMDEAVEETTEVSEVSQTPETTETVETVVEEVVTTDSSDKENN